MLNALGGGIYTGESWAAGTSGLTSVGSDDAVGPTPLKDVNPDTFSLPQELGFIQEAIKAPDSKRTVIHIQDAHCNYAAQKTISQILNYLTTEYGIYAVNCEGGAESYDLSVFTSIKQKNVREKTADFFVKEGVVNAAEYFAVNNPQKVKLWGVEDPDLYIKNLSIYKDSLSHKEEVDKFIRSINYILDNLKRHIYSESLLEFDSRYISYKDGKLPFKEYISYLLSIAQKALIDVKAYPDIYLLSQTIIEEDKINFKRANNEKDEVVDKLKKILSRNELDQLVEKVSQLKLERISQADFYSYLVKKTKSIKLDLSSYPELQKYVVYISLYSAIDKTKISSQVGALEDKIKESLYENDTQRELGVLSKNLILTKNIFNISLTRQDYTYYREHIDAFAVFNYVNFIDRFAPLYKIQATLDKSIQNLDKYRFSMDGFYECSLERDKAFVKNIKYTDHDRPNSIIITGGFHTENLRSLFAKEGVSYISIMPKFKIEKGYESPYLKRLTGQRTALENVIDTAIPAILNLQVVNILSKLALKVEGAERIEKFALAVAIIAAINAGHDFIMKIDAKVPVEGMRRDKEKFVTFTQGKGAEPVDYSIDYALRISAQARGQISAELTLTNEGLKLNLNPSQAQAPSAAALQPSVESATKPVVQIPRMFDYLKRNSVEVTFKDGFSAKVDPAIAEILLKVDKLPFVECTIVSCSGHLNEQGGPFIAFRYKPDMKFAADISSFENDVRERINMHIFKSSKSQSTFYFYNESETFKTWQAVELDKIWSDFEKILDKHLTKYDAIGKEKAAFEGGVSKPPKVELSDNRLSPSGKVEGEGKSLVKPQGQLLYESAVGPAMEITSITRKNTATRIISLVSSDAGKALVGSFGQTARSLVGPDIHLNSYVDNADKRVWMPELRKMLEIELKNFVENDMLKLAPLMEIRIKEGEETRKDVNNMIKDILTKLGYGEKIEDIISRIRLVPVYIEQGKQTNPAMEFFADMGMLECDRYINGDYGDERTPPKELQNSFLALLKLSITNFDDFKTDDIKSILNAIFNGIVTLRIKPINWESVAQWRKANQALLQSV